MRFGTKSRGSAVVSGILLAATFLVGAPAPAQAADRTEALVSSDGRHFGTKLSAGLFDGFGEMVPGDTVTGTFWVKNPISTEVAMRVSVRNFVSPSQSFSQAVTFSAWDSVSDSVEESPLVDFFDCKVVVPSREMAAGQVMRVDLTLTMLDVVEGRIAQNDRGELSFVVAMRDGEAGPFPHSACDDDAVLLDPNAEVIAAEARAAELRRLAMTGSELPTAVIFAAGILIGTGFFLVGRRRRKREDA
jgi:LPXTG-motif cell wall-anchored protein